MTAVLNPLVSERRFELAESFRNARFFPHVVIDDFFTRDVCRGLVDEFPTFNDRNALNERGEVGKKAYREDVRRLGGTYALLDQHIQSPEFLKLISDVSGIDDLIYDPEYIGGGTHDNVDGSELDIHIDFNYHPKRGWHRRLNLIVFLNPEWEAAWGGAFELHKDPWSPNDDEVESVPPFLNQGVLFETSEVSWHGFNQVCLPPDKRQLSRRSFAIYLYTRDRPEHEIAPSHATLYVQRPLPDRFQPGRQLTSHDVQHLTHLIARRDTHMRYLYGREKEFSARIERLEKIVRQRVPFKGFVEQVGEASGIWEDLWVGQDLALSFRCERPISTIRIDGYVPDFFPSAPKLLAEVNGVPSEIALEIGPFQWPLAGAFEAGSQVDVTLTCDATCNLQKLGRSDDIRDLGFLLTGVAVE